MHYLRTFIFILFFLVNFSCNRSQVTAFSDLKQAFIGWYLKSNPVKSEEFNQLENVEGWRDFSKDGLDEYFADLQRFFIELSQIDKAKLSGNLEFEYLVLWSYLRNTIYFESKLNPYKYDLNLWSKIIQNGLDNINLECGTLTAREENILKSRLIGMENFVQIIDSHLESPVEILNEDGIKNITKIQNRMLTFLYECQVDSNLYDRWDKVITNSNESLDNLIHGISNKNQFEYPNVGEKIWENGYEIYFGQFLEELISDKELNNEIQHTFSTMLEIALTIYLKEYDEPIWVSKQDTIQVLKTVFKTFENNNVLGFEVVQKSIDIKNNLEYQFKNNYFSEFKYPKFDFKVGDSISYFSSEYFTNFTKNYRAYFLIPEINDSVYVINGHHLEYNLINDIFPGKLTLNIQNSKSSDLLKLLRDSIFYGGWKIYVHDLILKSKYRYKNPEVSLLMLEHKILSMLKLKAQIKSNNNEDYLIESELVYSKKSKRSLNIDWINPFPAMDYLLLKEILELKEFHLKNKDNDINSFNNFISEHGPQFIFVRQNLVD